MEKKEETSRTKKIIFDWIIPIVFALVATLLIRKFILFKVYVPTGSMIPTIQKNDQLFVTRVYKPENLKRGDIVVFHSEELQETLIKRLIGLPNDKIEIKAGKVFINGIESKEDYVKNQQPYDGEYEVPEGKYFFLGDNRSDSNDARMWENHYIDGSDVIGKAQLRVYPFNRVGLVK